MDVTYTRGAPQCATGVHSPDERWDGGGRGARTQCELRGPSQSVRVSRGVRRTTHGQGKVGPEKEGLLSVVGKNKTENYKHDTAIRAVAKVDH